ncbi:MAG: hypothetical protein ABEJ56_05545 [Candidatus Nanohaloarchaea archaeon]
MAETTEVFDNFLKGVKPGDLNLVMLALFLTPLVITGALWLVGLRSSSLAVIVTGGVWLSFVSIIYFASQGAIIRSPVSEAGVAASFIIGYYIARLLNFFTGGKLSFFSVATDTYLSVLSSAPTIVQEVTNLFMAPVVETLFLYTVGPVIYLIWDKTISTLGLDVLDTVPRKLVLTAVPIGLGFARLHGAVNPTFLLFAATIGGLWVFIPAYEDLTKKQVFDVIPVGIVTMVGFHFGHNLNQTVYSTLGFMVRMMFPPADAAQFAPVTRLVGGLFIALHLLAGVWIVRRSDDVMDLFSEVLSGG